ncbi:MAG: hypothetical protein KGL39_29730 [Patescibacteria group bacterium]|nr:hypothetical protein [Patescibacteria group bacterium]
MPPTQTFQTPFAPSFKPAEPDIPALVDPQTPPAAQVSFNTVPDLPEPPDLDVLDMSQGYLAYGLSIAIARDKGLIGQLVGGKAAGALVDFMRVNTGGAIKVITVCALRVLEEPELPTLDTGSTNDVLLGDVTATFAPFRLTDGSLVYGVITQRVYGLQQIPSDSDMIDMGSLPFDPFPAVTNRLNPADYLNYLVGPAAPVTGGPSQGVTY